MPRFFCESPITENTHLALEARVAQHLRVLRLRVGEEITLFDGAGGEVPANLKEIGKREMWVTTRERSEIERETDRRFSLNAGLIANDRFDWLIQKATELGTAVIQPIYSERAQRIPGDVDKRVEHWRGVVIAACEQCGRNTLPLINAPVTLEAALNNAPHEKSVLMDADGDSRPSVDQLSEAHIFVGPEGGFSAAELQRLREHCAYRLRIGETILRAETAAISAIARLL